MKKYSILFILMIWLTGCKKSSPDVNITGEIKGLTNDTIYLYSTDGLYDLIDTLYAKEGKFSHKIKVDTTTSVMLLFDNQTEYPVFLDKGNQITITGDVDNLDYLSVSGNTLNDELTAFQQSIKGLGTPSEKVLETKAENFIRQHHSSLVSLYLLNKYFVQKEAPDFTKIKNLIELMTGILQDQPYLEQLNDYIDKLDKAGIGKYAPFFNLSNPAGKKFARTSEPFIDKYLLINFWASWADSTANSKANKELKELHRTYKSNKNIGMLGISFDVDRNTWKEAVRRDTLNWEQVFDPISINSTIYEQFAITKLPTNILLAPDGKILARDIEGEILKAKLKELLAEKEKQDKEQKKDKKKKL